MTDVVVVVGDDQSDRDIDGALWGELARHALIDEGVGGPAEMSLTFVDEPTIADMNERYMDESGSTDVLSFPIDGETARSDGSPSGVAEVPRLLGDVLICPVVAERNAPDHAGTFEDELALLVVHGVLHLLGYDHMEPAERALMQRRERELLDAFHRPPARWPWE